MSPSPERARGGRRLAIILLYVVGFWGVLPAALILAGWLLDAALGLHGEPSALGLAALVPGGVLLLWAGAELQRRGHGLPISALPPDHLVVGGPYRMMRHPIYVGWNAIVFGLGLLLGSPGLSWIVAPAVAPAWIAYALLEERTLIRRFGAGYRHYKRRTGLVPGPSLYSVARLLIGILLPVRVEGGANIPVKGAAVLVPNHACYLDPGFVARTTSRTIWYTTTAEVYRGSLAPVMRRMPTVPLRRYRPDPVACREVVRLLAEGELVCIFPEGERSPHGGRQAPIPHVAATIARFGAPVIPVVIIGGADVGPRWAATLRRRPVVVRVGPAIRLSPANGAQQVADAWGALAGSSDEPVHLRGLDMRKISRILWRCPSCGGEAGFRAADLSCDSCGSSWLPRDDGFLEVSTGEITSLADMARAVSAFAEDGAQEASARGFVEESFIGPARRLAPLGRGALRIDRIGVTFQGTTLPIAEIRSVTTERADTLQVATAASMWQFKPDGLSVFRSKNALDAWLAAPTERPGMRPA